MWRKMYRYFERTIGDIVLKKTWKFLWKGDLQRENESLLMAAENNAIRTNYVKVKINNTQLNCKFKLWDDRHETVDHIINGRSRVVQKKYKTWHLGLEGDPLGIMREIKIWQYYQMLVSIGFRSYGNQTWPIKWNAVSSMQRSCRYCYMDALLGR